MEIVIGLAVARWLVNWDDRSGFARILQGL